MTRFAGFESLLLPLSNQLRQHQLSLWSRFCSLFMSWAFRARNSDSIWWSSSAKDELR